MVDSGTDSSTSRRRERRSKSAHGRTAPQKRQDSSLREVGAAPQLT